MFSYLFLNALFETLNFQICKSCLQTYFFKILYCTSLNCQKMYFYLKMHTLLNQWALQNALFSDAQFSIKAYLLKNTLQNYRSVLQKECFIHFHLFTLNIIDKKVYKKGDVYNVWLTDFWLNIFSKNIFLFKNTKQNSKDVQLTDFFKTHFFQTLNCSKMSIY